MSMDTMYFNSSRTIPSRGRHQQARLQKPDRRIENQTKLRRQQSTDSVASHTNPEEQAVMSQFAYSGYGNQEVHKNTPTDPMGFVSDDLKQLLSMADSSRRPPSSSSSQPTIPDVHLRSPPGSVPVAPMSPLHGQQGLFAPVVMPPPMMVNNMPIPGPHPYPGIPHYQISSPMAMPMASFPPQMYQHQRYPQNLAPAPSTHIPLDKSTQPESQSMQSAKQPLNLAELESRSAAIQPKQSQTLPTQEVSLGKATKPARDLSPKNNKQNNKKKFSKKNTIPPQQVPVTFSSSHSNSSRGKRESNHGRSEMKSNGHSKCYAGATFAAEAPQVTSLPKPSFV